MSTRERGRASVWEDIHTAALDIAESERMAAATIDRISAAAGISRRTFFNYFPTKEAAILGLRPLEASPESIEELADTSVDKLTRTVRFLAHLYRTAGIGSTTSKRRREIIAKSPTLVGDFIQMKMDLVTYAQPFIQPLCATDNNDGEDDARVLVSTANALLTAEYKRDPSTAFSDSGEFIRSAISNFRKAMASSL